MVATIASTVVLMAALIGLGIYTLGLRRDLHAAQQRVGELQADNDESATTNTEQADELRDLEAEVRDLLKKLTALRGERRLLRRELAAVRAELEDATAVSTVSDCGDVVDIGAGVTGVSAENVDCETALSVARLWQESCFFRRCDESAPLDGYVCRMETVAAELVNVTCADSSGGVVRFEAGS